MVSILGEDTEVFCCAKEGQPTLVPGVPIQIICLRAAGAKAREGRRAVWRRCGGPERCLSRLSQIVIAPRYSLGDGGRQPEKMGKEAGLTLVGRAPKARLESLDAIARVSGSWSAALTGAILDAKHSPLGRDPSPRRFSRGNGKSGGGGWVESAEADFSSLSLSCAH